MTIAENLAPRREARMDAARGGRIKYLGCPCRKCGAEVRYTMSGRCVACSLRATNEYQKTLRQTLRAAMGA